MAKTRRRGRQTIAYRNRRGETVTPASVSATVAKQEFGGVLEAVLHAGAVIITKHDGPKAVLISLEDFEALAGAAEARLDTLSTEFDGLLDRMQTVRARTGMKAAFAATPKQLGKAAVAVVRKRG